MAAIYPADTFQEGVDLTIEASNQLAQVVRGDANTEVMVADGSTIPSIRKAQTDSMYFKEPEVWTTGQTEIDYLQLKKYINPTTNKESWWFAKSATVFNPVAMGTSPFGDDNWTLYTPEDLFISGKAEYESIYQALKGKAAEAGYNLVRGSFEEGGTLTNTSDVLWHQATGRYYNWYNGSAKTVVAGSTPSSTGGISPIAWVDRTDEALRGELLSQNYGANIIANVQTGPNPISSTVADYLNRVVYADDYLTGDDAPERLQSVADYAESINAELVFNGNKTYKIKQTLYIGNFKWKTNGALFEIISDASFIQTGAAARKTEGAILTKSAVSAGYGYSTVSFSFDTFRYTFSRPIATDGVKTAFLLENVGSFTCDKIVASTPTGQDTSKCIFDAYGGVQNVTIGSMLLSVDNVSKAEAFWIRNSFPSRDTKNINIGLINYDYTGADEALAIYPFNAGYGGAPDVNNIVIGTFNLKIRGSGYGLSFIDLSGATYSPKRMRGIFIENVNIEVYATKANPFFVKADSCAPRIGNLFIKIIGLSGGSGSGFAVRGAIASGQTESFKIDNLCIDSATTMPSGTITAVYGLVFVDYAHITTSGGAFSYLIADGVTVLAGVVKGTYTGKAVRNAQYIGKACSVYGVTEGVIKFLGKLYVDTAVYTGQILFLYSSATQTPETGVTIDADVILSGAGTVTQVVNANATLTYHVPVDVSLRIKNPTNLTIPANFYSGSYKLTSHDVVNVRSDGAVRIAQALSI